MEMDDPFEVKEFTKSNYSKSRETSAKDRPKVDTGSNIIKQSSSQNLDQSLDHPNPQIYNDVSPAFGETKSPSTGTGLIQGNKVVPISNNKLGHSNTGKGIYNLPSKFLTLQNAENVVEVFDLTKGREIIVK